MPDGSARARLPLAALGYLLLADVATYPLVARWRTALPHDLGDPVLNTWLLWWDATARPLSQRWWQAPAFYPSRDVLAFSEHLLGLALFSAPIQWLTANPVLAYNVVFLLSYVLCGIAAYLLAFEATGRRDAAWLAGVVFAFAPYRVEQGAHVQVLAAYGMPAALAAAHAYLRSGRTRWLAAGAAATLLQGLSNGYYLLFFPVLAAAWILWFGSKAAWRRTAAIALAGTGATALALPILLHYRAVHAYYGFVRSPDEIAAFSADLTSLLTAPASLRLWGFARVYPGPEGALFPGLTIAALLAAAITTCRTARARSPRVVRTVRGVLTLFAGLCGVELASYAAFGPWSAHFGGLAVSVRRPGLVFAQLLIVLAALAASSPSLRAARRRRSAFAFYLLAGAVMWLFALGPVIRWRGAVLTSVTPYGWLLHLPGFDGLRVPARFWMLALVCLSAAGAAAYARLVKPGARWSPALLLLLTLAALADSWTGPLPMLDAPSRSPLLERDASSPVLELPLGATEDDLAAMYRAIFHGQPVANGYSGYEPAYYPALNALLDRRDPAILERLASLGVRDVRVDRNRDADGRQAAFVAGAAGTTLLGEDSVERMYRLAPPAASPPPAAPAGVRVPIAALDANVRPDLLPSLLDGRRDTRWETGPQRPGQELGIALDAVHRLSGIELDLGPSSSDFPRRLVVEVSSDDRTWATAWDGPTALAAFDGALRNPRLAPVFLPLGGRQARYLRLRQTGADPIYYWSAVGIAVYAARDDTSVSP
jgi:F5/8 type C domain